MVNMIAQFDPSIFFKSSTFRSVQTIVPIPTLPADVLDDDSFQTNLQRQIKITSGSQQVELMQHLRAMTHDIADKIIAQERDQIAPTAIRERIKPLQLEFKLSYDQFTNGTKVWQTEKIDEGQRLHQMDMFLQGAHVPKRQKKMSVLDISTSSLSHTAGVTEHHKLGFRGGLTGLTLEKSILNGMKFPNVLSMPDRPVKCTRESSVTATKVCSVWDTNTPALTWIQSYHPEQFMISEEACSLSKEITSIATRIQKSENSDPLLHRLGKIMDRIDRLHPNHIDHRVLRHQFIQTFSQDRLGYEQVRQSYGSKIYQRKGFSQKNETFNPWALIQKQENHDEFRSCQKAAYFHATDLLSAEKILQSGKVLVMQQKMFRGAFVSTRPEMMYGPTVLIFNRQIEQAAPLLRNDCKKQFCWMGFGRDIPVNQNTLEGIAVKGATSTEREELQKRFSELAGRNVMVIEASDLRQCVERRDQVDGIIIPTEWNPDADIFHEIQIPSILVPPANVGR